VLCCGVVRSGVVYLSWGGNHGTHDSWGTEEGRGGEVHTRALPLCWPLPPCTSEFPWRDPWRLAQPHRFLQVRERERASVSLGWEWEGVRTVVFRGDAFRRERSASILENDQHSIVTQMSLSFDLVNREDVEIHIWEREREREREIFVPAASRFCWMAVMWTRGT